MFITVINDCFDDNVKGRIGTRVASLFGVPPTYVGVGSNLQSNNDHDPAEYEAAGCLIDVLDAANDAEGVVLVNVANRHAKGKKWPNGTPFGYFYLGKQLVVSTIDGLSLSLIKKLKLTDSIHLFDIPTVMDYLVKRKTISSELAEQITQTQFRSFEFEPRAAKWLTEGVDLPFEKYSIENVENIHNAVWYVDNFGNTKTTLLPEDINFKHGKKVKTLLGEFTCYDRLKDVPNREQALIIGSSGYKDKRFLELVIQGVSAAKTFNLQPGSKII